MVGVAFSVTGVELETVGLETGSPNACRRPACKTALFERIKTSVVLAVSHLGQIMAI